MHENLHALELLLALKKFTSHILKHCQSHIVHIHQVVFHANHILVLLIERLLAFDDFLILSLLHELIVNVREDIVPVREGGLKSELSTVKHS